jgi:methylated-DNA-[protein]-cysteine S-methyltransferase
MKTTPIQVTTTSGPGRRIGAMPAYWTESSLNFNGHQMPVVVGADPTGVIVGVRFGPSHLNSRWLASGSRDDGALITAVTQLEAYAAGELTEFELPLHLIGSNFQLAVWKTLLAIPYGTTSTYGRVAASIGRGRSASRAVGTAVGSNPIPIIVPCHRVIGSDGSLTGFGGGLDNKVALLAREGVTAM